VKNTGINPLLPVLICCTGVALFSVMDVLMKGLSIAIGAYNAMLWRGFAGCLICVPLWFYSSDRRIPPAAILKLHLYRGLLIALMAWLFFWALARLPLAESIALSFIAPIIALYLAAVLLGERIRTSAIVAALVGLAGVVIIVSGKISGGYSREMFLGIAAILASAVLFAYNLVLQRQQAQLASPIEITSIQNLIVTLILLCAAPWFMIIPSPHHIAPAVITAILAIISQIALSWAYARAEAQILIPMEYTAFLWAAVLGWLVFHEPIVPSTIIGTILIVAGCLYAMRDQPKTIDHIEADVL
jgi:S-adenosylmethionine uptake transporter